MVVGCIDDDDDLVHIFFYTHHLFLHSIASKSGAAAAVDPVDVAKVRQVARDNGLTIRMVLTTHAHRYAIAADKEEQWCGGKCVVSNVGHSPPRHAAHFVCLLHYIHAHTRRDHDGGNVELAKTLPQDVKIVGGKDDNVAACTHRVQDNDTLTLDEVTIQCLHTPLYVVRCFA